MSAVARLRERLAQAFDAPDADNAMRRACSLLLSEAGQDRPPIRLRSILKTMQVDIDYHAGRVGDEIASLRFSGSGVTIAIARSSFDVARGRARFSIAHEIAHLAVLRALGAEGLELSDGDAQAYREMERLCDLAASHLLMPRERLSAAVRRRGIGKAAVRNLAELFDVSRTALFRGIGDLVPDGAISEWRHYRRRDGEAKAWRVWRWHAPHQPDPATSSSDGNQGKLRRPWLPIGCTLKHLAIESQLPDLEFDLARSVEDVELTFKERSSRYDAVLCRWQADGRRQLGLTAEWDPSEPSARLPAYGESVIVVLGRRGRVDADLFAATR